MNSTFSNIRNILVANIIIFTKKLFVKNGEFFSVVYNLSTV